MAYTPTTWVDGTTPINAANLNKIEQGVDVADQAAVDAAAAAANKIPLAEKAAVNGVASLDAAGKVPLAQLPDVGAQLTYEGDYVAATEYQDGDVVVKDGVAYLCVGGPTTVAPDPVPWGAAALAKVAYGTSLPASPVDGQEAILVDSLTNPSYQWRFRYNAGSSSAYKWEFVGGTPKVFNYDQGGAAMNNPGFATASGWYWWVNPQGSVFPVPRSGDYLVRCKLTGQNTHTTNALSAWIQAAAVTATPAITLVVGNQARTSMLQQYWFTLFAGGLLSGCVAGTHSVGMAWFSDLLAYTAMNGVWVEITPVRVS